MPGVYIQEKIRKTTVEGSTYGAKKTRRYTQRPCRSRSARSASSSAIATSGGVVRTVNRTVCPTDAQKSPDVSTCR